MSRRVSGLALALTVSVTSVVVGREVSAQVDPVGPVDSEPVEEDIDPGLPEDDFDIPAEEIDAGFVHTSPSSYVEGSDVVEAGVYAAPAEMAPAPARNEPVVGGVFDVEFGAERSALVESPLSIAVAPPRRDSTEPVEAPEPVDQTESGSDAGDPDNDVRVEDDVDAARPTGTDTVSVDVEAEQPESESESESGEVGGDPGPDLTGDEPEPSGAGVDGEPPNEAESPNTQPSPAEVVEVDDPPAPPVSQDTERDAVPSTTDEEADAATGEDEPSESPAVEPVAEELPAAEPENALEPEAPADELPRLERATVTLLDEKDATLGGFEKVAFLIDTPEVNLARVESSVVEISISYDAFRDAYGGDWAGRLQLVQFNSCWLNEQRAETCRQPQPVDGFVNDPLNGVITAEIDLLQLATEVESFGAFGRSAFAPTGSSGIGLSAGAHSSTGNFGASTLASSSEWAVGLNSGDFSWSYPVSVLAPPAGVAPSVSVSYNSGSIDGLTSDENTQGGVLGPGWSAGEAFIERSYKSCAAHGGAGGDLCYVDNNASLSMAGASGRLIELSTSVSPENSGWDITTYQLEDHSGWVIEKYRRNNWTTARGGLHLDNDREYWRIRANDGTEYVFGYGKESGRWSPGDTLKSVDTVPVRGIHSGQPCKTLSYSWCHQAYRWNLDRVTDANGRVTTYRYTPFVNYYNVASLLTLRQPYVASSVLDRIEYGQVEANVNVADAHTNEVRFVYDYRCIWSSCPTAPTSGYGSSYPDIPNDHICSASSCSKSTPTFFQARKLLKIQKYSRKADATLTYSDRELFTYEWVDTDGAGLSPQRLWLRTIQHVGQQSGADIGLRPIRFDAAPPLPNRVDYNESAGVSQMKWYRITSVIDEIGSQTLLSYHQPAGLACNYGTGGHSWNNNSYACFPRYWAPNNTVHDGFGIWNKYVVDFVEVRDQSWGGPTIRYDYDYKTTDLDRGSSPTSGSGGMGWHSDRSRFANDPYPQKWYNEADNAWYSTLSWGDYRGFSEVTVTVGGSDPRRSVSTHRFYRGMHDDLTSHSSSPPPNTDVQIQDSQGTTWDYDYLAGRERESFTRGVGSYNVEYSGEITTYKEWTTSGTNGTATEIAVKNVRSRVRGGVEFYKSFTYDSNHRLVAERDYGDTTVADNRCIKHTYNTPNTTFPDGLLVKTEMYPTIQSVSPWLCTGTVLSENTWSHDASGNVTTTTTQVGDSSSVFNASGNGVQSVSTSTTYEPSGWRRPLTQTDAFGNATTTDYQSFADPSPTNPAPLTSAGNHVTKKTVVTNAAGHVTYTTLDYWGNPTTVVDPDGRLVRTCYDVLGRVWKVFLPGDDLYSCTTTDPASIQYTYSYTERPWTTSNSAGIQNANPTYPSWRVDTKTLFSELGDTGHVGTSSHHYTYDTVFLDGLGRTTEQWATAPAPAANHITFTRYDSRGNIFSVSEPQGTSLSSSPGAYGWNSWFNPSTVHVEQTTLYDPIGRPILHQARDNDVPLREATTSYSGLTTTTEPMHAIGGTSPYATTRTTRDAFDNVVKTEEFQSTGGTAVTTYQFNKRNELTVITNPNASTVTWMEYNQLGWPTYTDDDNAGASEITYYENGEVRTRTDAEQNTTHTTVDAYGRPNSTRVGTASGPLLSETRYDPLGKKGVVNWVKTYDPAGTLAAWEDKVAFDAAGRLTHHHTVVYAANSTATTADNEIASWQDFHTTYTRRGQVATQTYPGVPGTNLPNDETITYKFNTAGLVDRISSPDATGDYYLAGQTYTWRGQPDIAQLRGGAIGLDINHDYRSADNRLSRRTATIQGGTHNDRQISDEHYTYDHAGNIVGIFRDPDIPGVNQLSSEDERECFYYDTRQRLTGAHTIGRPGNQAIPNCAGSHSTNPIGGGPAPYSESFAYDKTNKHTNYDGRTYSYNTTNPGGCLAGTDTSKYDAVSNIGAGNGRPAESLDYDCNGSITSRTTSNQTTTYGWDHNNRLDTVTITPTGGPAETSRNLYSATGQRLLRIDPNGDKTVYLGTTELRWNHATQTVTTARYYPTGSIRDFDNNLQHTATTINNSIAATLTATNATINQRHYTPYGKPRTGNAINDKGFLNQTEDPNQNLVYLNNRHYDPTIGTFASVDPLVASTMEPYIYGSANPVTLSDSTGLCTEAANMLGRHVHSRGSCNRYYTSVSENYGGGSAPDFVVGAITGYAVSLAAPALFIGALFDDPVGTLKTTTESLVFPAKGIVETAVGCTSSAYDAGACAGAAAAQLGWLNVGTRSASGPRSSAGSHFCSFSGDTEVLMADGTTLSMSEVVVGDWVLAEDPETGERGPRRVTALWLHEDSLVDLSVGGERIRTTEDHPFWNQSDYEWQRADALDAGDMVLTASGAKLSVEGLDWGSAARGAAYNLTVEGLHTYFVLLGDDPVLVHNVCPEVPRGRGSVPPADRDPRRVFTPTQKADQLAAQGGMCAHCGRDLTGRQSAGHHTVRHADGGRTNSSNISVVCAGKGSCHTQIHSGNRFR